MNTFKKVGPGNSQILSKEPDARAMPDFNRSAKDCIPGFAE